MFGLFSSKEPQVRQIIVPFGAMAAETDAAAPMAALGDFVTMMMNRGQYRRWELPIEAMQAYHADYYYTQVMTGGHSQFIYNSRLDPYTLADIEAGLTAMGGGVFLETFEEMIEWTAAYPEEARAQDGVDVRAPSLDDLDERFYIADGKGGAAFYGLARPWLEGLHCLRVVPDGQYNGTLDKLCAQNPLGPERADDGLIGRLEGMLTTRLLAGLQMAGRRGAEAHRIGALTTGSRDVIDGQPVTIWGVQTDKGIRLGAETESGVLLMHEVAVDVPGAQGPRRVRQRELAAFAPVAEIDEAIRHAGRHMLGTALVAIMRRAGLDTGPNWVAYVEPAGTTAFGEDTAVYAVGIDAEREAVLYAGERGAALFADPDEPELARVSRDDVAKAVAAREARVRHDERRMAEIAPKRPAGRGIIGAKGPNGASHPAARVPAPEPTIDAGPPIATSRGRLSLFGTSARTRLLDSYGTSELTLIDEDIADLHQRLDHSLEIGINLCLMPMTPPVSLLDIGEVAGQWTINGEQTDRIVIRTTIGSFVASEVSRGVSVHRFVDETPGATLVKAVSRGEIERAQAAAQRYPVALGLFLMLEQARLTERFLAICHTDTDADDTMDKLLLDPKIQMALIDAIGEKEAKKRIRGVKQGKPTSRKPDEAFVITLDGADGLASVRFNADRAHMMPMEGAEHLFETIPIIPMSDLVHEEKALIARLKTRELQVPAPKDDPAPPLGQP